MSEVPRQPAKRPHISPPDQLDALPAVRGPLGELSEHLGMIVALLITVALVTGVAFGLTLLFTAWMRP